MWHASHRVIKEGGAAHTTAGWAGGGLPQRLLTLQQTDPPSTQHVWGPMASGHVSKLAASCTTH